MRKSSLYIMILFLFCNLSCTEYLDVKNKGEVIPETAEEFSALLHRHLYNIDGASEYAFFGAPSTVAAYEAYTDNWDADLTTKLDLPIYVGIDISSLSFRFKSLYEVIRDCNIVIEELKERDTDFGKKLLATAYTIRGVCYYTLMRNYCEPYDKHNADKMLGVPIVKVFDMEGTPERSNLKETADFVVENLKQAISLNQTDQHYRFYVDVSKAYLARTYFWVQEWELAASTAKEVLDKYPLISGEAYKEMIQTEVKQLGNVLIRSGISKSEGYVYTDMQKTKGRPLPLEFVNLFTERERDIRYTFSFDAEFVNTKMLKTSLRSAEMCLIMAESYAHSGDTENALKYLNHLRENRISGYTPYTESDLPVVDPTALIQVDAEGKALTPLMSSILNERRKELYLEGDRWYELKRNGRPERWCGYNGVKYVTAKFLYTFPIPKEDIALNAGLIQNPGYETY